MAKRRKPVAAPVVTVIGATGALVCYIAESWVTSDYAACETASLGIGNCGGDYVSIITDCNFGLIGSILVAALGVVMWIVEWNHDD